MLDYFLTKTNGFYPVLFIYLFIYRFFSLLFLVYLHSIDWIESNPSKEKNEASQEKNDNKNERITKKPTKQCVGSWKFFLCFWSFNSQQRWPSGVACSFFFFFSFSCAFGCIFFTVSLCWRDLKIAIVRRCYCSGAWLTFWWVRWRRRILFC